MDALETARLRLLPLVIHDAAAMQNVFPQWEIVRWLTATVPWPYPDDGAATFLRNLVIPSHDAKTAWHWSIRPKERANLLIGSISLLEGPEQNRGFWLDPAWQGQGLMTEASNAVTDYWFGTLGKSVLRVPKAAANPASRRISEKQGMRVVSRFVSRLVSGEQEMELWEISRDEWLRHQHSRSTA
ncbi:GNAT family N-acetyltransferase [Novosphingobium sp. Rr 2-17]|uniref:GNAT family N-acetyltransferase n=1 Tax=Novosphingobium sp. Rr 2-17 TaxID=555793 RepID=UPI0005BCAB60|nr:GNAT family N-acetyltransferase [Novosphingobium sp. Rr 2-17]